MTKPRPGLGIVLILMMGFLLAAMDTTIRWLGPVMPVLLLLTTRYLVQAVVMSLWLARGGRAAFRTAHPKFQVLRGVLLLVTSVFGFFGLQHLPVAEFTAINMLTPLGVTMLAALVLKEPVSRLRWALVAGGFVGALIVIRPGSGLFGWAVLFPLGCVSTYAAFQTLTSRMSTLDSPYTTHFWTGFTGFVILLPLLLATVDVGAALAAATPQQIGLLLLIGACGTSAHLMLILALGVAPTAALMPFVYLQIGSAALLGWWVFGALPDAWGWVGMAVIAACGAAGAWLNVTRTRRAPTPLELEAVAD